MAVIFNSIDSHGARGLKRAVKTWIKDAVEEERYTLDEVVISFCSDSYITEQNILFLSHDYPTDIITFDRTEHKIVSGDLLISTDTVRTNAKLFGVSFEDELLRVMIHGVLHMTGYDDKMVGKQKKMRAREDYYINKFKANISKNRE